MYFWRNLYFKQENLGKREKKKGQHASWKWFRSLCQCLVGFSSKKKIVIKKQGRSGKVPQFIHRARTVWIHCLVTCVNFKPKILSIFMYMWKIIKHSRSRIVTFRTINSRRRSSGFVRVLDGPLTPILLIWFVITSFSLFVVYTFYADHLI